MEYIFIFDPGHRQDTPGKRNTAKGFYEYEFNEDVAKRTGKLLQQYGRVFYTITTHNHANSEMTAAGRSANLNARCRVANEIARKYPKAKVIFVSIHANAFHLESANGYGTFVYKFGTQAEKLAKCMHKTAKEFMEVGVNLKDRGIRAENFAVLRLTNMPAVLIENFFYTNNREVALLKDSSFRDKVALHIAKGCTDYFGLKWKGQLSSGVNSNNTSEGGMTLYPKLGDKGIHVKELQQNLVKLGYKLTVDSSFGPATDKVVRQFQEDNKLVIDGSAGPSTQAKIAMLLEAQNIKSTIKPSTEVLYRVRKEWNVPGSQLGAYKNLDLAFECVEMNPGFHVFNEQGKIITRDNNSDLLVRIRELENKLEAIKKILK